jgi:hypothetical protein
MLWLNGIYIYIYIYTHNNNNNNNNNSTFNTQRERDIWGTGTISIINEYQSAICEAMVFIILLLCTFSLDPIVCEHLHHS